MNIDIVKIVSPEGYERMKNALCPTCGQKIAGNEFKDALSVKEWGISGMCQKCQDQVFEDNRGKNGSPYYQL